MFALMVPATVLAEVIDDPTVIGDVPLSVAGATPETFEPSAGHKLKTSVSFSSKFAANSNSSTGSVKVLDSAGNLVRTLNTWDAGKFTGSFTDWDGKPDAIAANDAVCKDQTKICPDGNYTVEVHAEFVDGEDTRKDTDTAAFKIFTTPEVAISNLAVSKASFNPLTEKINISFSTSADGFVTVDVLDGTTVKKIIINNKSLVKGDYSKTNEPDLEWNGKDDAGNVLANKEYTIRVQTRKTAIDAVLDAKTIKATVNTPSTVTLTEFTVSTSTTSGDTIFDPAPSAGNELLTVKYTLTKAADNVSVTVVDSANKLIKTIITSSNISETQSWNGIIPSSKLLLPGTYKVKINATKAGENPVTDEKTFTVVYSNSGKGEIQNFQVLPVTFDPDVEDAVIEFKNSADTDITVEIQNAAGEVLKTFSGYQNDNFNAGDTHSIVWNGKNTSGIDVSLGSYKVVVITRNAFGVVVAEAPITVNNSGGSISTSNSHINDIYFSPSTKFRPAEDDELLIRFDVLKDIDELKIYAIRGADKIELFNETDIAKENNIEVFWDGTDDNDDYASQGSWKIQFESKLDSTELKAAKSINVEYTKPNIDDLELSKTKFDNDIGEFTSIMFRVDEPSIITIKVLVDGSEDENVVEDMDVEKDKWYSVNWDGGSYDYEDNLDLKLIAANIANDQIYDTEKISVDLAEDTISSSKSNVTVDYITPAVTDGYEAMDISYDLEDTADLKVTIHKGKSSTGSEVASLLNINDQDSGSHTLSWDGKDKNGNKLSDGFYTYKIVSYLSGTETETGLFVVGKVGDVEGSGSTGGSGSGSGGGTGPGVVIDGGNNDDIAPPSLDLCAGFSDVLASSPNCAAISWVKSSGVFQGYGNGTFGEFQPINRAEVLKVIMEALGLGAIPTNDNLGFKDVQVGAWYMAYLNTAKTIGIFQGDAGKGTARPSDSVNRAEVLKLMFETLKQTTGFEPTYCSFAYTDVAQNDWFYKYVCGSKQFTLFSLPDGLNFMPSAYTNRAEVAQMFYKLHLTGLI